MENKKKFVTINIWFTCIIFFALSVESLQSQQLNNYHWRKGINEDSPRRQYKFKDVSENVGYITKFPNKEVEQIIPDEVLENCEIEYRIFTSIEDTELFMVEHFGGSNAGVYNIIDYPLSKGEIGNNCWYNLSIGIVEFLRNNVYVYISPKVGTLRDISKAEWLAREIDALLIESNKVSNANQIPAPQIQSVEILSELPSGWNSYVKVKINAIDVNSKKLFYREYGGALCCASENGELLLFLNESMHSMEDTGKAKVKIWVWNEDNITSSVEKEIPFLITSVVGGEDGVAEEISNVFILEQNYPNPFNPSTTIKYSIPVVVTGHPANAGQVTPSVRLTVYDILGKEITTLVNKKQTPGNYQVTFNAEGLPSGIYFYKLTAGDFSVSKTMMLLK